jgi:hypothetical protein
MYIYLYIQEEGKEEAGQDGAGAAEVEEIVRKNAVAEEAFRYAA